MRAEDGGTGRSELSFKKLMLRSGSDTHRTQFEVARGN